MEVFVQHEDFGPGRSKLLARNPVCGVLPHDNGTSNGRLVIRQIEVPQRHGLKVPWSVLQASSGLSEQAVLDRRRQCPGSINEGLMCQGVTIAGPQKELEVSIGG